MSTYVNSRYEFHPTLEKKKDRNVIEPTTHRESLNFHEFRVTHVPFHIRYHRVFRIPTSLQCLKRKTRTHANSLALFPSKFTPRQRATPCLSMAQSKLWMQRGSRVISSCQNCTVCCRNILDIHRHPQGKTNTLYLYRFTAYRRR